MIEDVCDVEMVFKRMTFSMPIESVDKLCKIAKRDNRTLSNMIVHLIESYVSK